MSFYPTITRVVILIGLLITVEFHQGYAQDGTEMDSNKGAVVGYVVDQSGNGIAGARIRFSQNRGTAKTVDPIEYEIKTDDDGEFVLRNYKVGLYYYSILTDEYALPYESFGTRSQQSLLMLHPGMIAPRFIMQHGKTLSGRVLNPENEPVAGAEVIVNLENGPGFLIRTKGASRIKNAVTSDENGWFRFTNLRDGYVSLIARAKGYSPAITDTGKVRVGRDDIELHLGPTRSVAGVVQLADDSSTSELTLKVAAYDVEEEIRLGADGRFSFDKMPPYAIRLFVMRGSDVIGMKQLEMSLEDVENITINIEEEEKEEAVVSGQEMVEVRARLCDRQTREFLPGVSVFKTSYGPSKEEVIKSGDDGSFDLRFSHFMMNSYEVFGVPSNATQRFIPKQRLNSMMGMKNAHQSQFETDEDGTVWISAPIEYQDYSNLKGKHVNILVDSLPHDQRFAAVKGRVETMDGNPISNINVVALVHIDESEYSSFALQPYASTQTNEHGEYVFESMLPGVFYTIQAQTNIDGRYVQQWTTHIVALDQTDEPVETMLLDIPGSIKGSVLDVDGEPLDTFHVEVRGVDHEVDELTEDTFYFENAGGEFSIYAVPPGSYRLTVVANSGTVETDIFKVLIDETVSVSVQMTEGISLCGVVRSASGVVRGASVDLAFSRGYSLAPPGMDRSIQYSIINRPTVKTGEDGSFQLDGLFTIPFEVMFDHPNYAAVSTLVNPEDFDMPLDVVLTKGGRVSGRVTDGEGNPYSHFQVALRSTFYPVMIYTQADENGEFHFPHIQAGTWRVYGENVFSAFNREDLPTIPPVDCVVKDSEETRVELRSGGAELAGRVTYEGNGVEDAQIQLMTYLSTMQTVTDSDGNFRIKDAPGGTDLRVHVNATVMRDDGESKKVSQEYQVAIPLDGTVEKDFVLRSSRLQGVVLDRDTDEPIADRVITVSKGSWYTSIRTGVDGSFRLDGLEAEVYHVYASAESPMIINPVTFEIAGDDQKTEITFHAVREPGAFGRFSVRLVDANTGQELQAGEHRFSVFIQPTQTIIDMTPKDMKRFLQRNGNGRYESHVLPAGDYMLVVHGGEQSNYGVRIVPSVSIKPKETTQLDVDMHTGVAVGLQFIGEKGNWLMYVNESELDITLHKEQQWSISGEPFLSNLASGVLRFIPGDYLVKAKNGTESATIPLHVNSGDLPRIIQVKLHAN